MSLTVPLMFDVPVWATIAKQNTKTTESEPINLDVFNIGILLR